MTPGVEIASQEVVVALGRLGVRTRDMARLELRGFGLDVTAEAKRRAPVKTGKLRRSITFPAPIEGAGYITGKVGPHTPYARMVEEGFSGTENVRAFVRRQTKAFGKDIAERMVSVRAHTRNVNRPAAPYLVPAFEAVKPLSDRLRDGMSKLGLA